MGNPNCHQLPKISGDTAIIADDPLSRRLVSALLTN